MLSLLCFSECKCIYVGMNLNLYCMCSCKITCSAKEYVLKGGEQLTEAWWVFESVIVHHHHFGSSEAEHSNVVGSHLALDGTPEGDTGWCQPSEYTSSMFENENDMSIYAATLCQCSCRAVTKATCSTYVHCTSGVIKGSAVSFREQFEIS